MFQERALKTKQERGINSLVDHSHPLSTYLVFSSGEALADELALEGDSFLDGETIIVLGEARLPLLVHHQDELDHSCCTFFRSRLNTYIPSRQVSFLHNFQHRWPAHHRLYQCTRQACSVVQQEWLSSVALWVPGGATLRVWWTYLYSWPR